MLLDTLPCTWQPPTPESPGSAGLRLRNPALEHPDLIRCPGTLEKPDKWYTFRSLVFGGKKIPGLMKSGREPMCVWEFLNKNEGEKQTFQAGAQPRSIKAVIRNHCQDFLSYCTLRDVLPSSIRTNRMCWHPPPTHTCTHAQFEILMEEDLGGHLVILNVTFSMKPFRSPPQYFLPSLLFAPMSHNSP